MDTTNTHDVRPQAPAEESLQIGAFSGYNRRPMPDRSGMMAQIYGENGPDADVISALSLTKFQDADVYVRVHLIKDSHGQIMKANGAFPTIASFRGKIQRPKPLRDGMVAHIFAPNGVDADQVNAMGLSKYLDAFVFVEILKPEAAPSESVDPSANDASLPEQSAELDELAGHLTPFERKALQKRSRAYAESNRLLKMSGFLRNAAVWAKLGTELDYQEWISKAPCCASGDAPCRRHAEPFKIPLEGRYMLVPFCSEHAQEARAGDLPGGSAFLRLRREMLIQEWAWEHLKKAVGVPIGMEEPDPHRVAIWARDNGLGASLPANYLDKLA